MATDANMLKFLSVMKTHKGYKMNDYSKVKTELHRMPPCSNIALRATWQNPAGTV